jgi:anti-anti-sigma factor
MKYDVYKDRRGEWRWRLVYNDRIIADSADSYRTKIDCLAAVARFNVIPSIDPDESRRNRSFPSGRHKPRRALSVFLCHSSDDKPSVRDLYTRLRSTADYINPWLDEEELLPGQRWEDEIPEAVRNSDIVLVCMSKASTQKTGYVQKEIKFALDVADTQPEGTIFIIPVKLEGCLLPKRLSHLQFVNLFDEKGFDKLMRALSAGAEKLDIEQPTADERATEAPETFPPTDNWALNVRVRQEGDVAVLDLKGRIGIGEGTVAMRNIIRRLQEKGQKKILMNLHGINYVDNSGLGELIYCYTVISRGGGQFKLLNLPPKILNLLQITKLLTVFDTYDDEGIALDSFK